MIRSAAIYLVKNGPVAMQDRWEEDPGYSPFTLAATISALLVAADFAEKNNDKHLQFIYVKQRTVGMKTLKNGHTLSIQILHVALVLKVTTYVLHLLKVQMLPHL